MKISPLVSVIIPTYKRSDFLLKTIDSVLNQTYPNIEIIVVDDNGLGTEFQKETKKKLQPLIEAGGITYIPHENNKNGSAARNTGFRASKGDYINFLDDDDVFMPNKIEKQVSWLLNKDSVYGACFCNTKCLTPRGVDDITTNYDLEGNLLRKILLSEIICNTSAILFKRSSIDLINGFDESYVRHQDFEIMVRFFRHFQLTCTTGTPLLILNWANERTNRPNPDKLEKIEEKFYNDFEKDLKQNSLWEDLHHLWHFSLGWSYLLNRNYKKAFYNLRISNRNKRFCFKEVLRITKYFFQGIISY